MVGLSKLPFGLLDYGHVVYIRYISDIHAGEEAGKIEINGMTKIQIIRYSVIGVVGILLLVLLFSVLRSCRRDEIGTHDELIKAKDETIEAIKESRDAYQLVIEEKDKNIAQLKIQDSILQATYSNNQNVYKVLDAKIRNIPNFISRIANNDDSIRFAFSTFR